MKINKNHFQKDIEHVDEFPTTTHDISVEPVSFNDFLMENYYNPRFIGTNGYIPLLHQDSPLIDPYDIQRITDYTIQFNDGSPSMTITFSNRRTITIHDRHTMQQVVDYINRRTIPWNPNQI